MDGYQLLKMNELIKNAAAWRARMPKANRFDKYFDKETTKTTPKVQINSATLQVMGQTAKDCGYTKEEFIEAVENVRTFRQYRTGRCSDTQPTRLTTEAV